MRRQEVSQVSVSACVPADCVLVVGAYVDLVACSDDAQGVLLARPRLRVQNSRARIHVQCALRQSARLEGRKQTTTALPRRPCQDEHMTFNL